MGGSVLIASLALAAEEGRLFYVRCHCVIGPAGLSVGRNWAVLA
jgi:hypothetical protein